MYEDTFVTSNFIGEYGQSPTNMLLSSKPLIDPVYINITQQHQNYIHPNDQVIIIPDKNKNKYKCIPSKFLATVRTLWDTHVNQDSVVDPITITYCPYTLSTIIYKGNWRASGLLYNSNTVLTNSNCSELLVQLLGKIVYSQHNNFRCIERYSPQIFTWSEWRQSDYFNNTKMIANFCLSMYTSNLFPIVNPLQNQQYLGNRNQECVGIGFFDNTQEGYLFISKETNESIALLQKFSRNINNVLSVECKLGIWIACFPYSKIL